MKTLVLGGCGFIGRHVVNALTAQHLSVVVLDVHADPSRAAPTCPVIFPTPPSSRR